MPKQAPKKFLPRGVRILFEDADLLIIEKPCGLLSVPARYEPDRNALTLMTHFIRKGQSKSRKELFAVNRLDRETSGILVFAKSLSLREHMHDDWNAVKKTYLAVLAGKLPNDEGLLESYLRQDENYRVRSVKNPQEGKLAQTRYRVLARGNNWTCVCAELITGRKNQIRVQFSEIEHAVLGDKMYGHVRAERLALHAWKIAFPHPRTGKLIELESPPPPFFSAYENNASHTGKTKPETECE